MKIMAKKKKYKKPFSAAVDHYMRIQGHTNKEMGIAVGYPDDKMLSSIRLEKSGGSEKMRRKIAKELGFDSYDLFLKEGERLIQEQNQKEKTKNIQNSAFNVISIDQQHADVIRLFQNKKKALEINQILLDVEKIDPGNLERAEKMLTTFFEKELETLKKRKASNGKG